MARRDERVEDRVSALRDRVFHLAKLFSQGRILL